MVEEGLEGLVAVEAKLGGERWRLVEVYVNGDTETKLEAIRGWMVEEDMEIRTVIAGDFNVKTGRESDCRGIGK